MKNEGSNLYNFTGFIGSSEFGILGNLDGAFYTLKCCKVAAPHSGHVYLEGAIYTDSWLLEVFGLFLVASLGGAMNLKKAFYTDFSDHFIRSMSVVLWLFLF